VLVKNDSEHAPGGGGVLGTRWSQFSGTDPGKTGPLSDMTQHAKPAFPFHCRTSDGTAGPGGGIG